jgi:hypothetical protein
MVLHSTPRRNVVYGSSGQVLRLLKGIINFIGYPWAIKWRNGH